MNTRIYNIAIHSFLILYFSEFVFQSDRIFHYVCGVHWYAVGRKHKIDIMPIIIRSKYTLRVTAGKFMFLSLETFSKVRITFTIGSPFFQNLYWNSTYNILLEFQFLKTSAGYVSVLISMKSKWKFYMHVNIDCLPETWLISILTITCLPGDISLSNSDESWPNSDDCGQINIKGHPAKTFMIEFLRVFVIKIKSDYFIIVLSENYFYIVMYSVYIYIMYVHKCRTLVSKWRIIF